MLQQLADHRRDGVSGRGSTNGLQIAAGAERAAFALDHQHLDIIGRLDIGAELFELFGDGKVDGIERCGAVQGESGNRALDFEQRGIVGQGCGGGRGRHGKNPGNRLWLQIDRRT